MTGKKLEQNKADLRWECFEFVHPNFDSLSMISAQKFLLLKMHIAPSRFLNKNWQMHQFFPIKNISNKEWPSSSVKSTIGTFEMINSQRVTSPSEPWIWCHGWEKNFCRPNFSSPIILSPPPHKILNLSARDNFYEKKQFTSSLRVSMVLVNIFEKGENVDVGTVYAPDLCKSCFYKDLKCFKFSSGFSFTV